MLSYLSRNIYWHKVTFLRETPEHIPPCLIILKTKNKFLSAPQWFCCITPAIACIIASSSSIFFWSSTDRSTSVTYSPKWRARSAGAGAGGGVGGQEGEGGGVSPTFSILTICKQRRTLKFPTFRNRFDMINSCILCPRLGAEWIGRISWLLS